MIIYLSGREIGIQWDKRGVIHTLDRDGNTGERFTRPLGSSVLYSEEDQVIDVYTSIIEEWS